FCQEADGIRGFHVTGVQTCALPIFIALIRSSKSDQEAKEGLMARFGLTERQAVAILDMQLRRLTGLEREKIEEEYQELLKRIARAEERRVRRWAERGGPCSMVE